MPISSFKYPVSNVMRLFLTILALAYAVSPYDFIPDWLVGFGWLDDIAILGILWWYIYRYSKGRYRAQGASPGGKKEEYTSDRSQWRNAGESVHRDPYSVLGIDRRASQDDIRLAYKNLAGKYHPDKVSHLGKEFQALAEKRFREIQEAYEKLKIK